jgi:hypothetical protein
MHRLTVAAALVALALAASTARVAAQSGNSVKGKLMTEGGKAAASVIVSCENATGTLVGQTATNNEGDFYFSGLGGGTYFILVGEVAYEPVRERVEFTVEPGEDRPGDPHGAQEHALERRLPGSIRRCHRSPWRRTTSAEESAVQPAVGLLGGAGESPRCFRVCHVDGNPRGHRRAAE